MTASCSAPVSRARVAQEFELEGGLNYMDFSDSGDDTSVYAAGRWYFTPSFAAGLEAELGDDVTTYGIGVRWSFAPEAQEGLSLPTDDDARPAASRSRADFFVARYASTNVVTFLPRPLPERALAQRFRQLLEIWNTVQDDRPETRISTPQVHRQLPSRRMPTVVQVEVIDTKHFDAVLDGRKDSPRWMRITLRGDLEARARGSSDPVRQPAKTECRTTTTHCPAL